MIRKKTLKELDRYDIETYRTLQKIPVVVVLDNVRSGHNVGSIFRTCDAFRVEKLFLCGITPVPPHPEIHKTALGATESVAWEYVETTSRALQSLKDSYMVVAVEQAHHSIPLVSFRPEKPLALIFGHEVYGIDEDILSMVDVCVEIPQYGTKHSLNVSVCAGIVLYHLIHFFDIF